MTAKRQRPSPSPGTAPQHQIPFDIAVNMLLRCEHFLRSLAFQSPRNGEESIKEIRRLCNDFHETLFIIDHTLHKYRVEHNKARVQGGKSLHEDDPKVSNDAYHLLSEINEQLTDYAFLIGQKIHPWDIPYVFKESSSASTNGHAPPAPEKCAQQINFQPATWNNRVARQTTTPLTGFPLKSSADGDL